MGRSPKVSMTHYILRRILIAIPTLLLISMVIFAVLALAPGDPLAEFALNPAIPEATRELIRIQFGLDQPWPIRYLKWLIALLRGDWGFSFASKSPVIDLIWQRLPQTLVVVGSAHLIGIILAIPIGIISAIKQYSLFDTIATMLALIGLSLPSFFIGIIAMLVFAVNLKWFPLVYSTTLEVRDLASLGQQVRQMFLPVLVLVVQQTGAIARFMRAAMLDNLSQDYVRTARAKGLREWIVVLRHLLPNSLIPVVTLVALSMPSIFSGAIITETLFRVNGIGALLISSINTNDTPVVMAITFIFAVLTVIFNLIADILYAILDPRVRYVD
ncbi:binding-protein-dependent transport systems inner membrane component [Oscillochloris trichoides DG-6]|uniref:Binding-protein-dependent transport systems inner membrane component n=1 Tax=Oscillochloris trichoides DG-6 TaxID=765420 RepID=E1IGT2_9CHLR|nr:binding-protein-dependent transport systems inner membrane component [Oscillochloris trichoides DG-6]